MKKWLTPNKKKITLDNDEPLTLCSCSKESEQSSLIEQEDNESLEMWAAETSVETHTKLTTIKNQLEGRTK